MPHAAVFIPQIITLTNVLHSGKENKAVGDGEKTYLVFSCSFFLQRLSVNSFCSFFILSSIFSLSLISKTCNDSDGDILLALKIKIVNYILMFIRVNTHIFYNIKQTF